MEEELFNHIKDALAEDTPPAIDARIRAAIRPARPRRLWWTVAAAAGLALMLAGGAWLYGHERAQQIAALGDDGNAMLEIIGMASVDDVYSVDTAQM